MAWTDITEKNIGEDIDKAFLDAILANLNFLKGATASSILSAGANGSFENDSDNDTYPDSWVFSALPNGTGTIYNATIDPAGSDWSSHGGSSFRFTRTLGVGNGGGTLTSEDYFEVSPNRQYFAQWQMKCSVVDVRVKVEFLWYTRALVAISSTEIYNENAANPTAWALRFGSATPPATAKYAKLKITGGDTSPNNAGLIYFDEVSIQPIAFDLKHEFSIETNGTYRWISPISGVIEAMLYGAGGGGGGCTAGDDEGGGGGGGAFVHALIPVTSGTTYTIVVGNGGAGGGVGATGSAGTATTFTGGYSAGGGSPGIGGASGGAGGAGGTAAGGIINTDGGAGTAAGAALGGNGGRCTAAGWRGGVGAVTAGDNGDHVGAGGAGGGDSGAGAAGGNGRDGKITIRYKS